MVGQGAFPRALRPKERDIIESVLPVYRPGYRDLREMIGRMVVLGEGRRGPGNIILGFAPDDPDLSSPLSSVVAFGVVEITRDVYSVTVRKCTGNQIDVEIVSSRGEAIPDHFEEKGRWTYSSWAPGNPSPCSGETVREVSVDESVTLAIAPGERRLWIHDRSTGMVHPIPVTNYHNELMIHRRVRDPEIALDSRLFFADPDAYSDEELRDAFITYNVLRHRVEIRPRERHSTERSLRAHVRSLFRRKKLQ
ncbi:MAG: hypothetical protein WBG80_02295 [Bacteroidota bacterium]